MDVVAGTFQTVIRSRPKSIAASMLYASPEVKGFSFIPMLSLCFLVKHHLLFGEDALGVLGARNLLGYFVLVFTCCS